MPPRYGATRKANTTGLTRRTQVLSSVVATESAPYPYSKDSTQRLIHISAGDERIRQNFWTGESLMQLVRSDIVFILEQIQFEFAAATPVSPTLPQGLRNPSGNGNNLVARQDLFGAADHPIPRASGESHSRKAKAVTSYQRISGIVIGSQPRVSQSGATCCATLAAVAHAIEHRVAIGKRDCVQTNR